MKTAMQEVIQLVKKYDCRKISYKVLFFNLEELLKKEKEQIIDAFENGRKYPFDVNINHCEQYYNQIYDKEL